MDWSNGYPAARSYIETYLAPVPELALFGAVAALLAGLFLLWKMLGVLRSVGKRFSDASAIRQIRKDDAPGYRILIARPDGAAFGFLPRFLGQSARDHLSIFNFGAPFRIADLSPIRGGLDPKALRKARKWMSASDADMVVWATRESRGADGLVVAGLSRGGGLTPEEARVFTFALPGRKRDLAGHVPHLAAYKLAKGLQPAIATPQSFRPDKMKLMTEAMDLMLKNIPAVAPTLRDEIEADYCAACVHVAESSGDLESIDRIIALRLEHLEKMGNKAPAEMIVAARIDLGRALIARAEKQFDQRTVQEAIQHLSTVVETLRANPTIQQAQSASDAMFKAQTMIETRKRFSVNFGA